MKNCKEYQSKEANDCYSQIKKRKKKLFYIVITSDNTDVSRVCTIYYKTVNILS